MELIDTHAHLDMPEFESDLPDVLHRAAEAGVGRIICVGTSMESSRHCVELARRYRGRVFASVGIHPTHCAEASADDFEQVETMARLSEVVAIGETGLDFRPYAPGELQADYLRRHIRLSLSVGKPLILHAARSDEKLLRILGETAQTVHGVRHCFDASAQIAAKYARLGVCLGFGGVITRPGCRKLKVAARMAPAGCLLVETDCPYVMPAGQPGTRNEPAFIVHAVNALAALRNTVPEEIGDVTSRNAARLFFGGE